MKPKVIHQEAMDYSFKARQALEKGAFAEALGHYITAAELESKVAEFYFDKPDLEPTRSVIIRSAAFLNIKAGKIEEAKKFIFFGLLNSKDEFIIGQLNDALELAISFNKIDTRTVNTEFTYLNILRQRSVHYVLEPANPTFGTSVSLEAFKDFANNYIKSLKAYAISTFKHLLETKHPDAEQAIRNNIDQIVNPLITSSAYGSFKFSIANDFLSRNSESEETTELKAAIIIKYHNEIFTNPLADHDIDAIKDVYSEEEINEIFRPLSKIKSANASYKVGYYDTDLSKRFANKIINKQRKRLLTTRPPSQEDIGELENFIIHKRSAQGGKIHKTTLVKQQMKSADWNITTNLLETTDYTPLILSEEIILDVSFDSNSGFTISYSDFKIENTDIEYTKALKGFYNRFYIKMKGLAINKNMTVEEEADWQIVRRLIINPDVFLK
ncbi:MAG: hypothetical protein ACT6QS_00365 [Flavobacteriales bacterium]